MIKKNPTYRFTVFPSANEKANGDKPFIIEYPTTCRFNSKRGLFSNANRCTIELFNLSEGTRTKIFQEPFVSEFADIKYVKLEAGYDGMLSQIFYGRILQAYSTKEGGQTDIITKVECLPYDIFNSHTSYTFTAGTSYKDAYKAMSTDLKDCQIGNIGSLEGNFQTQTTFEGNTLDCLNQLTGGHTFVDNGIIHTLMPNEVNEVPIPLITDTVGLLNAPVRRGVQITIKTLFEPTLIVGQLLEIKSSIQPEYNGQYKVIGFTHDCIISPVEAGQRITTIVLNVLTKLPRANINLTNQKISGDDTNVNAYKVKGEEISPVMTTSPTIKWPMPTKGSISSYFGARKAPKAGASTNHIGIDIAAPMGAPVKAPADGTVFFAGTENLNGKCIRIDHGTINGASVKSTLIHLNSYNVQKGQKVKQGTQIGTVGSTGISTGPHLHISIYRNGSPVDPLKYIDRNKFV